MPPISAVLRKVMFLPVLVSLPTLQCQEVKTLEWRIEQQPATAPCTRSDLAFANAPEQIALEKSYNVPLPPGLECESIQAAAFNMTRVLQISRRSVIDDGVAYTLIQPKGAFTARLLPFSGGGHLFWGQEDDWHNRATMNAILQTLDAESLKDADWLAISLAYLTILDEAPTLGDLHYSPGPGEHFESYSIPGLLREVPAFMSKHLLPTAKCSDFDCEVRFFYRTEPVMPLKTATFKYTLQNGKIYLKHVEVLDYAPRGHKKIGH